MSKEIDFSKAPEGATHYRKFGDHGVVDWYKESDGFSQFWSGVKNSWDHHAIWFSEAKPIPPQWSIYTNDKPLCDLSDEQAAALFNAWRGGIDMEKNINNKWFKLAKLEPCWLPTSVYRIKQKSERELFILVAEKIIDESGCFKDDRAIAISTACCLFDSGKFKLVEQPK